jgi:hypothetical protein
MLTNGSREYLYIIMPMVVAEVAAVAKAAEQSVAAESQV